MTVAVVYFSNTGTTHQIAEAISNGVVQQGCACELLRIAVEPNINGRLMVDHNSIERQLGVIDQSDAVIFGSPTYMGGPAAPFKEFADVSSDRWDGQIWNGKLAAGFTVGANPGGDQLATLQYFSILAAQHGMLWVNLDMPADHEHNTGSKLNAQLGFAGVSPTGKVSGADKRAAVHLGARVAMFSERLRLNKT